MKDTLRALLPVAVVLIIPIIPVLLFGEQWERAAEKWLEHPGASTYLALGLIGLHASDILLPVPGSLVSTVGGWRLGWALGTLVSFLGMSAGAIVGFATARAWGYPLVARLSSSDQLRRMKLLSGRTGPALLVVCRPMPVLAEASVLWTGLNRLSWRRFLPPVLLTNLAISLVYSLFGHWVADRKWLPWALVASVALPLLLATMLGRLLDVTSERGPTPLSTDSRGEEKGDHGD